MHPHLVEMLRACVEAAPGINSVDTIKPHPRGGFSVFADRMENMPSEFEEYFEKSKFMLVF